MVLWFWENSFVLIFQNRQLEKKFFLVSLRVLFWSSQIISDHWSGNTNSSKFFCSVEKLLKKLAKSKNQKNFLSQELFLINWEVGDSQKGQYLFEDTFELPYLWIKRPFHLGPGLRHLGRYLSSTWNRHLKYLAYAWFMIWVHLHRQLSF